MPRLYREAPLNSIWEGSGNINALDVLRILRKQPASFAAWRDEIAPAQIEPRIAREAQRIERDLRDPDLRRSCGARGERTHGAALAGRIARPTRAVETSPTRSLQAASKAVGAHARNAAARHRLTRNRRASGAAAASGDRMKLDTSDLRWRTLARRRWTARGARDRLARPHRSLRACDRAAARRDLHEPAHLGYRLPRASRRLRRDPDQDRVDLRARRDRLRRILRGSARRPVRGLPANVSPDLHPRRLRPLPRARRTFARSTDAAMQRRSSRIARRATNGSGSARSRYRTSRFRRSSSSRSTPASTRSTENRPVCFPTKSCRCSRSASRRATAAAPISKARSCSGERASS